MIDYFQLGNPLTRMKSVISHRARRKMYGLFERLTLPKPDDLVLDMGVTPEVTLPESNFFEKMYPYTKNITMSSIEDATNLTEIFDGAKFVRNMPGEPFPFEDNAFDILFCSAVLEHVGDYDEQAKFISECIRVSKKVFLTTPNKGFPVEFHTYLPLVHLLPRSVHQRILRLLGMSFWAQTQNLNLLTEKKLLSLIPEGAKDSVQIHHNRMLGLTTNLIVFVSK